MQATNPVVTRGQIEQALNDILSSRHFARAGRSGDFLRYVVEQSLSQQGVRLKGYTIGVEVFGRADDFDPQADNIVRVNAGRVRQRLADYYASVEGSDERLQITLPERSYAPVFLLDGVGAIKVTDELIEAEVAPVTKHRPRLGAGLLYFSLLVLSLVVVWLGFNWGEQSNILAQKNNKFGVSSATDPELSPQLLAERYFERLDYTSALEQYRKALKIEPENTGYLRQLGRCYLGLSQYDLAKSTLQSALDIDRTNTEQSQAIAQDLNYLGEYFIKIGQFDQAQRYLTEALTMAQVINLPVARQLVYHKNLARSHYEKEDFALAERHLGEAFFMAGQLTTTANALSSLHTIRGHLKRRQGKYLDAIIDFKTALSLKIARYGKDHHQVAGARSNLATQYRRVGQLSEALMQYQQALQIYQQTFGEQHSNVASVINNIGNTLFKMKKYPEAEVKLQQAMAVNIALYSENSRQVASNRLNLANVYSHTQKWPKSLRYYERAAAQFTSLYDQKHSYVAFAWLGIGEIYDKMGQPDKASKYYEKTLAIYREVFGPEHQHTLEVAKKLAVLSAHSR
jgi:tetratricopeptide (TPR) repeat protein